jgi:hypothetical protein
MKLIKEDFQVGGAILFNVATAVFSFVLLKSTEWWWVGITIAVVNLLVAGFLSFKYLAGQRKVFLNDERSL